MLTDFPNGITSFGKILPDGAFCTGNVYYSIPSTETFYQDFLNKHQIIYDDGSKSVYNTPQAAIDACLATRGDIVVIIGSYTITTPILVNKKGVHIVGVNPKYSSTGGATSITSAVNDSAVFTVSVDDVTMSDIRMTCSSGTGTVIGIDMSGVALNNCVFKNMRILKSSGTDNNGIAIKAGSPTSCTFENILIEGASGKEWASGLLIVAGNGLLVKGLHVSGVNATGITDAASTNCVYRDLVIGSDVGVGTEITGATSVLINSRNFAASEGTSTAKQANILNDGQNVSPA